MPDIAFTAGRQPIQLVRLVPATTVRTIGGHPVQAVRRAGQPSGDLITPAGHPISAVRLVDASGAYTTSQTPVTSQPEDVFSADGQPIRAIRFVTGVESPELATSSDGWPIEAVQFYDAAGAYVADASAEPDIVPWVAAVVTNGGTVSGSRQSAVEAFVTAEKAAGVWALTDDYWLLCGESTPQSLTSLKQRRLAVAVGSGTFTPNRDFQGDGVTGYVDTGFIVDTHKVSMLPASCRIGGYIRNDLATAGYAAGVQTSAARALTLRPRTAGSTVQGSATSAQATYALPSADSRGFTIIQRNGALTTDTQAYKNGVALARTVDPGSVGTPLSLNKLFIGGHSIADAPSSLGLYQIALIAVGAALTPAQVTAHTANVLALMTAVGANV